MKNLFLALSMAACLLVTVSCHKSSHTPSPFSAIKGLTSISHRERLQVGPTYPMVYVTWNFSGDNPLNTLPDIDSFYFGHEQLFFTGSNVTRLVHYGGSYISDYFGKTLDISYNAANQFDTIRLQYTIPVLGHETMAFHYIGNQISEVLVCHYTFPQDSAMWAIADVYRYTYTGNNISKIVVLTSSGGASHDSETYTYPITSRINNFAGCLPAYLSQEFIRSESDFLTDMPAYINPNIVETTGYTIITDAAGRITQRIVGSGTYSDTTFYAY